MNKTISRVLRTQSWTYCTDKQWFINNVYIEIWEESYVFNADIFFKSARSLRSLAILYTFSPVSNASSFNKAIYHEHIKWTNTRTYCTDKNMLLTNLTIARFQRKIRKFRLARSQSVTYVFGTYCKKEKKKKPYYQLLRKIWWLPHPRPRQGLYTRNCNGRNYSFYHSRPDDHLEGPYLLKTRELPGAPPDRPLPQGCTPPGALYGGPLDPTRMRRARCASRTYTVRYAHGFFRPPLFCKSWIRHCTQPPLLVQVACPPPPPWRGMPGTPLIWGMGVMGVW